MFSKFQNADDSLITAKSVKLADNLDLESHRFYDIVCYSSAMGSIENLEKVHKFCSKNGVSFFFSVGFGSYGITYNDCADPINSPKFRSVKKQTLKEWLVGQSGDQSHD